MSKRAALYLRVSTGEQTTANQRRELETAAERHGWTITTVYDDAGVSGGRDSRPGLDRMRKAIARKEMDVVMAWSVDRLGRSLQALLGLLGEMKAKGVDLYLHQQGLDTSTPAGKALFQMLGVFAEFERAIIRERIYSGLSRAKAQGTRSGRSIGRPRVKLDVENAIRKRLAQDQGATAIAKELGVGVGTVMRVKRSLEASSSPRGSASPETAEQQPSPTMADAQALARRLHAEGRWTVDQIQERVKRETGHTLKIRLQTKGVK